MVISVSRNVRDTRGEDTAEKTNFARGRSSAASDDGPSAQLLALTKARVFPAMTS
jgi:hypothetical protein